MAQFAMRCCNGNTLVMQLIARVAEQEAKGLYSPSLSLKILLFGKQHITTRKWVAKACHQKSCESIEVIYCKHACVPRLHYLDIAISLTFKCV